MKTLAAFAIAASLACAALATPIYTRFFGAGTVATNASGTNIVATYPNTQPFVLWSQPAWISVTFTNTNAGITNVVTWSEVSQDATITNTVMAWTNTGPATTAVTYFNPTTPAYGLMAYGDTSVFQSNNNATNGLSNMWFTVQGMMKSEVRTWGRGEP